MVTSPTGRRRTSNRLRLRIPSGLAWSVDEILGFTDRFCALYLDESYAELTRDLVGRLARKRPSPLGRGDLLNWAGGAIYTIGAANLLFDPRETPHLSVARISNLTGVAKSTLAYKSKQIREILWLAPQDPKLRRSNTTCCPTVDGAG